MDRLVRLKEKASNLPKTSGVYIMKDVDGNIIYIGKAKVLKNRVSQYFFNTVKQEKVMAMVNNVWDFDYILTNSELEALTLESNLIKDNQPFYNILLKDGKNHPYIKIDLKKDYPVIELTRVLKHDGAKYFGPYFGIINGREVLNIINTTFMVRDCKYSFGKGKFLKRPCLNYEMGQCLAPCVNKVTREEYRRELDKVIDFLNGNTKDIKELLLKKMQTCVELEQFEKAMVYRDNIKMLDYLDSKVITEINKNIDIDVFGYAFNGFDSVVSVLVVRGGKILGLNNYSLSNISDKYETLMQFIPRYYNEFSIPPKNIYVEEIDNDVISEYLSGFVDYKVNVVTPIKGTNKHLINMANDNAKEYLEKSLDKIKTEKDKTVGALELLKKDLNLKEIPYRIEGYDISHISGTNKVASMVVFVNGVKASKEYRKFVIKTVEGNNDFACMKEVLTRRLSNTTKSFSKLPNLILIDGGMGQLAYADSVLQDLGFDIDIISLAKREEEVYKPNSNTPIVLSRSHYGLKLLQKVRDESHRFAITFHRQKRTKSMLKSELKNIVGVGESTINKLLEKFKNIENIKQAEISELVINGINKKTAQNIYNYFHKN